MPTLLIVDDNDMNVDMLSKWLRRKGFETLAASNGQEAISMAGTALPDLILMDLSMPIMDGWEATRMLKRDSVTSHIPVIALSAHDGQEDKRSAIEAGCVDYATKPLDLKSVTEKIILHLESSANN